MAHLDQVEFMPPDAGDAILADIASEFMAARHCAVRRGFRCLRPLPRFRP